MASNTQQQAVAVTEKSIGLQLQNWMSNLRNYAVRKYDAEAWLKTAMLCILESKPLMECLATDAGKHSLYHALRYAASTGLSLNPQEGKACLVPRDGKIVYWIMSHGWVELLTEHPRVDRVQGFAVFTGDKFEVERGIDGDRYTHRPALDDRGDIRGFVSAIRLFAATPGQPAQTSVHYMTVAQMREHRDQYNTFKSEKSAWATSFEGRGISACVKLHIRRLALGTPAVEAAIAQDDRAGDDTEPADWRDVTPGTTAAEVESKLKTQKTEAKPEAAAQGGKVAPEGGKPAAHEGKAAERPVTKTQAPTEDQGLF